MKDLLPEKFKDIQELAEINDGLIKSATLAYHKIDIRAIKRLIDQGYLEKIKNGLYRLICDASSFDPVEKVSQLFSDGVICMHTALAYYSYIDPNDTDNEIWDLAFNKDVSKTRFRLKDTKIKPYFLEPAFLTYGVDVVSIKGYDFKIFSRDRLICECIKFEHKLNPRIFEKVLRRYSEDHQRNMTKLTRYCIKRNVLSKMARLFDFSPE